MKMSKWLCLALSLALFAGLFAGCSNGTSDVDSDGKMTIDWLMYSSGPADNDSPVELYFEEMFNVDFNLWYIERSKWDELLNIRFASNEIPDVFMAMSAKSFYKYVEQDVIREVSEETLQQYAPKIVETVNGYDPNSWKYSKVNGVNYAIPTYNYNNRYHIASVWRDDWLKNVGIDKLPETLEEYEEAFYRFRNDDPDQNGVKDTYALSDKGLFNSLFGAFGYLPRDMTSTNAMWKVKGDELVYAGVQPEMKEALTTFAKWYQDDIIDPEFLTGENTGGHWSNSQAFLNGRIGYTANGMYYHVIPPVTEGDPGSTFYQDFKKIAGADATYAIGKPPKGSGDVYGNFGGGSISMGGIVFGKQLENNEEKLAKILEIIDTINTTKDLYNISVYGFEGEHWHRDEELNMIVSNEGYTDGASLAKIGANNIFSMGGLYPIEWRISEADTVTQLKYEWAAQNTNYAKIENELPVELDEIAKYSALLDKEREQVYIEIITGEKPVDYFDTYVANWEQNGGKEMQEAANEWYKTFK